MSQWIGGVLRFLAGVVVGVLLIIGGALVVLYLTKDRIAQWALEEINRSFRGKVSLTRIQIGSLRDLPHLGVRFYDFTLATKQNDTLFFAQQMALRLNLWEALIEEKYRIRGLVLVGARLILPFDKRGVSPWQALFADTKGSSESTWSLERVVVRNSHFVYEDRAARVLLSLEVKELSGKIAYKGGDLRIAGEAQGVVHELLHQKKVWLARMPFHLRGELIQEAHMLIARELHLGIEGVKLVLTGSIQQKGAVPHVLLHVEQINLALEKLREVWADAPPALTGLLQGKGEIIGPVGKGHLPRIHLQAKLATERPFHWKAYPVQHLEAEGELLWDFAHPTHSQLKLSQFYLIGGDQDTLSAEGKYVFTTQKGKFHLNGAIRLENLAQVELYDSLQGYIRANLHLSFTPTHWEAEGSGILQDFYYRGLTIRETHAAIDKHTLTLTHLSGSYEDLSFFSSFFRLYPLRSLSDSAVSPLHVQGKLHIPVLDYAKVAAMVGKSSGSAAPPLTAEIELSIDTLIYAGHPQGPLTAQVLYKPDTFALSSLRLPRFAGGSIQLSLTKTAQGLQVYSHFQNLNLHTLSQELPGLDTLFPLLPHLRGYVSGEGELELPLSRGSPRWIQAQGNLSLTLRDMVVIESPYTYELFSLVPITDFKRIQVGSVQTQITLAEGVMRLDTTWLQANQWRMRIAGSHTLRGELAYDLWVEVPRMLLEKSQERIQEWVEEQGADFWKLAIKVSGTTSQPKFSWKAVAPHLSKPPRGKSKKSRAPLPVEEN